MMTKEQLIAQYKAQYPSLTYGVNDQVFDMSVKEYEQTIEKWADFELAKLQGETDMANAKASAETKLAAIGLTVDDLKALKL